MLFKLPKSTKQSYDLLTLFSLIVGVYALFQFIYLMFYLTPWIFIALFAGLLNLVFPGRPLLLLFAALAGIAEFIAYVPHQSNHLILGFFLWIFVALAWIRCALRSKNWDVDPRALYELFAPGGRLLLLTMYFFGVFHKINTDFLNPDVSCASVVMNFLVFWPKNFHSEIIYTMGAYGTLIVESAIMIMLLFSRTRYWAVVFGVLFHLLISFSAYRYYIPFSLMAIMLHFLFLNGTFFTHFRAGRLKIFHILTQHIYGRLALIMPLLLGWAAFISWYQEYGTGPALIAWTGFALVMMVLIFIYERPLKDNIDHAEVVAGGKSAYFFSKLKIINVLAALFFLSCFSPYFGFKTTQVISMFSNLRTEGGVSNHLIFQRSIPLFDYQNHLVRIIDTDDPGLKLFMHKDLALVKFEFEKDLIANPEMYVKFEENGKVTEFHGVPEEYLEELRHNTALRKYLIFQTVNVGAPRNCIDLPDILLFEKHPEMERLFTGNRL